MAKLKHAVCVLSALIFSYTAAYAAKSEYDNIHTVAVVPVIGETFTFARLGATIFGPNEQKTMPITDWGIDQAVVDQIQTLLSGRFTFKPIDIKAMQAASIPGIYLRSLPPDSGIDAYILVSNGSFQPPSTPSYLRGLGIYTHDGLFADLYAYYAVYDVSVYDAKTFKRIDGGRARMDDGGFLSYTPALRDAEKSAWADAPEVMTDQQRQAAKAAIEPLVQESLPHALRDAGLLDAPGKP